VRSKQLGFSPSPFLPSSFCSVFTRLFFPKPRAFGLKPLSFSNFVSFFSPAWISRASPLCFFFTILNLRLGAVDTKFFQPARCRFREYTGTSCALSATKRCHGLFFTTSPAHTLRRLFFPSWIWIRALVRCPMRIPHGARAAIASFSEASPPSWRHSTPSTFSTSLKVLAEFLARY